MVAERSAARGKATVHAGLEQFQREFVAAAEINVIDPLVSGPVFGPGIAVLKIERLLKGAEDALMLRRSKLDVEVPRQDQGLPGGFPHQVLAQKVNLRLPSLSVTCSPARIKVGVDQIQFQPLRQTEPDVEKALFSPAVVQAGHSNAAVALMEGYGSPVND